MQTRNIILGPTELNTIKISIYKEKENVQKKIEGKEKNANKSSRWI